MGLADTVKNLHMSSMAATRYGEAAQGQTSISRELNWLRELRRFTEENTDAKLIADIEKIEAYSQTEEGKKEQKQVYLDTLDMLERGSLARFYRKVLEYASIKQRKDKHGGGEKAIKAHWERLQRMERGIRRRYEKQRREADGCE